MSYKNVKVKPDLGKQTSQWWSGYVNSNERICGDTLKKQQQQQKQEHEQFLWVYLKICF